MSLSLPNPSVPQNGQPLDATPILQNELAIAQAIQSFDASQIQSGTLVASAFNASINPNTLLKETTFPFVQSGCVWSAVSSSPPVGTMTGGIVYINGTRITVNSVTSHTFAASSDTYVDVDVNGNITYSAVSNDTASPSIAANSIRLGIIITSATAITFANQGQTDSTLSGFNPQVSSAWLTVVDSNGVFIYPTDPNSKLLGYRESTGSFSTASATATQIIGLSLPVIIPLNRRVKVTMYLPGSTNTNTAFNFHSLWQGTVGSGTKLSGGTYHVDTTSSQVPINEQTFITPSSGLQVYGAGFHTGAGTATINADSRSSEHGPSWISVELM